MLPSQEEYEKGRTELQMMVASGAATVEQLRQQLLGGGGGGGGVEREDSRPAEPDAPAVPEDLLAIQSFIRWERNGKQNYSPEQQEVS